MFVNNELNEQLGFPEGSSSQEILNYYSQYYWKRRTWVEKYVETQVTHNESDSDYSESSRAYFLANSFAVTFFTSKYYNLYYSDSITIDQATGEITLDNPSSVSMVKGTDESLLNVVKRKYVWRLEESTEKDGVYYIPENSTINLDSYNNRGYYYSTPSTIKIDKKHITERGAWEIVSSNSEIAYPYAGLVDQYEYEFVTNPLLSLKNNCSMEIGSYVGTGTYGQGNQINLTFANQPKMVIITPKTSEYTTNSLFGRGICALWGTDSYSGFIPVGYTGGTVASYETVHFLWSKKRLQVYTSTSSVLNIKDEDFYYVALS